MSLFAIFALRNMPQQCLGVCRSRAERVDRFGALGRSVSIPILQDPRGRVRMVVQGQPADRLDGHHPIAGQVLQRADEIGRFSGQQCPQRLSPGAWLGVAVNDDRSQFVGRAAVAKHHAQFLRVLFQFGRTARGESCRRRWPKRPAAEPCSNRAAPRPFRPRCSVPRSGSLFSASSTSAFTVAGSRLDVFRQPPRHILPNERNLAGSDQLEGPRAIARYCRLDAVPDHQRQHAIVRELGVRAQCLGDRPTLADRHSLQRRRQVKLDQARRFRRRELRERIRQSLRNLLAIDGKPVHRQTQPPDALVFIGTGTRSSCSRSIGEHAGGIGRPHQSQSTHGIALVVAMPFESHS